MSATCTVDLPALRAALDAVKPFIPRKTLLPVMLNLRLDWDGAGTLTLTGNDLETWGSRRVAAQGTGAAWSGLVDPRRLADALPKGKGTITLDVDGYNLRIGGVTLRRESVEGMPPLPLTEEGRTMLLTREDVTRIADQVGACVSGDGYRPVLQGLCLSVDGEGMLEATASDGFRLGVYRAPVEGILNLGQVITVGAWWGKVEKVLGKDMGTGDLLLTVGKNAYLMETADGGAKTGGMVIAATFPRYDQLIPSERGRTVFTLDVAAMAEAVRKCAIVARDGSGIVRLQVEGEEKRLCVSARDADGTNTVEEQVAVDGVNVEQSAEGVPLTRVAVNAAYLRDLLAHAYGGRLTWYVGELSHPVLVVEADGKGRTVIMPMFVPWLKAKEGDKE